MKFKYLFGVVLMMSSGLITQLEGEQFRQKGSSTNWLVYSLTVNVTKLRNAKGRVQFSLYNKNGTIPDQHYNYFFRQLKGDIDNGRSTVTFSNLPGGRYAINILHDENNNGKVDKGFMLPKEGIGFSNYQSIGLGNRPNFNKASFDVKSNMLKTIKIIYF